MAGKTWNKDKYEKAIVEYLNDEYLTVKDLAIKYDFDRASFSRYLKKQNIKIRKPLSKQAKTYLEAKNEYINSEETLINICEKYSIDRKNFSLYLKENNIEVRNGFYSNRYERDEDFFEVINTEEKAYWLGFIFADGCVVCNDDERTYRLTIELSIVDKDHLIKFKNAIKSTSPIAYRKNRDTCSITINSKKIVTDLIELGAVSNKTNHGFISEKILQIENNLKLAFLRGYIDGDGFIDKVRNRIVITIKSIIITSAIKNMFKEYSFKIKNDISFFRLIIENKKDFYNLLNDIYGDANIYLNRKYDIYINRCALLDSTATEDLGKQEGKSKEA